MIPTIHDMSTKELLRALRDARLYGSWDGDVKLDKAKAILIGFRLITGGKSVAVSATEAEIVEVLNTRPHVPGKAEAKVLRRLQAQTGQSKEWLRAHPKFGQEIVDAQYPNRREVTPKYAAYISKFYGSLFGKMFKVVA